MARYAVSMALAVAWLAAAPAFAQQQAPPAGQQEGQTVQSAGAQDDDEVARQVAQRLAREVFPNGRAEEGWLTGWTVEDPTGQWQVDVSADDGQVTLEGEVPSEQEFQRAVQVAQQVPGVRSIRTELEFETQGQAGMRGSPQEMRRYVEALQQMARAEPRIAEALERGDPVPPQVLNRVPRREAEEALRQAGLSRDEFRRITERLQQDQSTQQRFRQVAQQVSGGRSGAQQGQSGAQPGASPQ